MTPTEYDLAIVTAERDGAREAYDRMKAERDAALDALHRVRRALGLGGVLGRPETIAESAERLDAQIRTSRSWEALCVRAAAWCDIGPERSEGSTPRVWVQAMAFFANRKDETSPSEWGLVGFALFARLMAIVSRPS